MRNIYTLTIVIAVIFTFTTHSKSQMRLTEFGGGSDEGSNPRISASIGDRTIFIANSQHFGRELWASDGTDAGTKLLKDIYPGPTGGIEYNSFYTQDNFIVELDGWLYFFAKSDKGMGIWKTDGTPENTSLFVNISGISPIGLFAGSAHLYYFSEDNVNNKTLVWYLNVQDKTVQKLGEVNATNARATLLKDDLILVCGTNVYKCNHTLGMHLIGNINFTPYSLSELVFTQFKDELFIASETLEKSFNDPTLHVFKVSNDEVIPVVFEQEYLKDSENNTITSGYHVQFGIVQETLVATILSAKNHQYLIYKLVEGENKLIKMYDNTNENRGKISSLSIYRHRCNKRPRFIEIEY